MNGWIILAACVAGGAGATLRWAIDVSISERVRTRFPLAIFFVNVTGSFALGFVLAFLSGTPVAEIIGTGFLGGYTTFSTVAVASAVLADAGMRRTAAVNIIATFVACVLAALGGIALGQIFVG